MFGWIEGIFKSAASGVTDAVKALVHLAVRGLYAFLHDIFRLQWDAWNDFWNGARDVWAGMRALSFAVYQSLIKIYKHWIPLIFKGIDDLYHRVLQYLDDLRKWAVRLIDDLYHWTLVTFDATRKWAIHEIWDPLFKSLTTAWHWLTHEGATMWHYFTHLPDFAELLFAHLIASLEKHAWDAGKLLGEFFLALIVRNLMRFVTLMEDIVDAIL